MLPEQLFPDVISCLLFLRVVGRIQQELMGLLTGVNSATNATVMESNATAKRRERLVPLLKDPAGQVRDAAAAALERLEGIGSFAEVTELLKRGDRGTKVKAIYALGKIGGERVLPPLIYCASRPEEDIRSAAIEVLGTLAHPRAFHVIARGLTEAGTAIQIKAIAALGNYRTPEAVQLLVPFLAAGDGFLDAEAALALGRIGGPELEERLLPLLDSPHPQTRSAAATALGMLPLPE